MPRRSSQSHAPTPTSTPSEAALPHGLDAELRADLQDALRGWYFIRRRRMPWRDEPSAYRVWVSEIMLQQTQVATVIPYFLRFIEAFPSVEALAAAPEDAVLGRWSGLGYYRRAKNLHAGAKKVAGDFNGTIPSDVQSLLTIPGIGRYTAGAIASIAFGVRAPVLDGNVARVLSRVFAVDDVVDTGAGLARLWALADALVPESDPSSHNQALMELGALVCSPRDPACGECPLADRCRASALGVATAYPKKKKKAPPQPILAVAGLCRRPGPSGDEVLFGQRPDGLLGGLWELPGGEIAWSDSDAATSCLGLLFEQRTGLAIDVGPRLATVEHQFTHRSLTLHIYRVMPSSDGTDEITTDYYKSLQWTPPNEADERLALSTLTRKVLAAAREGTLAARLAEGPSPRTSDKRTRGRARKGQPELPL